MKYLKKFGEVSEAIISPINMDELVIRLLKEKPLTIEDANKISNEYNVDIVTHSQFVKSLGDDPMVVDIPNEYSFIIDSRSGINFAIMNKFTNKINIVVNYDLFIKFLPKASKGIIEVIKSMIGHESIHSQQYDKMGNDPNKYVLKGSPDKNMDKYLTHQTEIMAYGYSIVDELKRNGYSKEDILNVLRKGEGHWVFDMYKQVLGKDHKAFNKVRKYAYLYVQKLFSEEE